MIGRRWMQRFLVSMAAALLIGCVRHEANPEHRPGVKHIEPDAASGTSMAALVEDVPLVHTEQFLPLDGSGNLVGRDDLDAQVGRVLENLRIVLDLVDADFRDLAKLNVYLKEDALRDRVLDMLALTLPKGARPAISFVSIELPHPDMFVGMDAVAAASRMQDAKKVTFFRSDALYSSSGQAHAGVLPRGGKVYVSGQAAEGDRLEAVGKTMESLHATLTYLGLSAGDVVQVKAFVNAMAEAKAIEEKIGEYYRDKPVPPIVLGEWRQERFPVEIEVIASRGETSERAASGDALTYVTPPGMSAARTFSRVAEVHRGDLVYVSGLYGAPGQDDRAQVQHIFATLQRLLAKAGSDFDHLAKATYYHSTGEAGRALNEIRPQVYHPKRPPAASKLDVRGVGREGATVTLDMIAVVPK